MRLVDLTARTRGPNKPRLCPAQCTLCGSGTGNGADGQPCVGCGGTGVPHRAGEIRAKNATRVEGYRPHPARGRPSDGKPLLRPKGAAAPDLPVRPTDGEGRLVSDVVFLALVELGWCRLAPFDDPAHFQGRML